MAAGTLMLGGIAAGPALAVTGFVLAGKGEKTLTQAKKYESKVNVQIESIKTTQEFLDRVLIRIEELDHLSKKLNRRAKFAFSKLNADAFNLESNDDIQQLQIALTFVTALSEIVRTPVLNSKGNLTEASHKIQVKYTNLVENGK